MISIVIRIKNEAKSLDKILSILNNEYKEDVNEIIVVDNKSSDNSVEVAEKYKCKVITIKNFTYGKALNLGMKNAKNKYVLLLSAHAIPVGKSFFKNIIAKINSKENENNIAGMCFINSIDRYCKAITNNYNIEDPIHYGLNAACGLINKEVWERFKFNEDLIACEDKEWSIRVMDNGFNIFHLNEAFFYFAERNRTAQLNRSKNEKLSNYILTGKNQRSILRIFTSFIKQLTITNTLNYFHSIKYAFIHFRNEIAILKELK